MTADTCIVVDTAGICLDVDEAYVGVASRSGAEARRQARSDTVTILAPPAGADAAGLVRSARFAARRAYDAACTDGLLHTAMPDGRPALDAAVAALQRSGCRITAAPVPKPAG